MDTAMEQHREICDAWPHQKWHFQPALATILERPIVRLVDGSAEEIAFWCTQAVVSSKRLKMPVSSVIVELGTWDLRVEDEQIRRTKSLFHSV